MYDSDNYELAMYALDEGMRTSEVARVVSASHETVRRWRLGQVPHPRGTSPVRQRGAAIGRLDPPKSGPLSGLSPDQIENVLFRAVLANLKADRWDPASISNGRKCELGERLRRATGLSLRSITGFLRISKGSYEYHRTQLGRPTRRDGVAPEMEHGYRFVREELRGRGVRAGKKVVRDVMREGAVFANAGVDGRGWYRKSVPNDDVWRMACIPLNGGKERSIPASSTASRPQQPCGSPDIPAAHSWRAGTGSGRETEGGSRTAASNNTRRSRRGPRSGTAPPMGGVFSQACLSVWDCGGNLGPNPSYAASRPKSLRYCMGLL